MTVDLERHLARVASRWERDAPAVDLGEIERRAGDRTHGERPDTLAAALSSDGHRTRSRWGRMAALGSVAAVGVVGLVAVALRSGDEDRTRVVPAAPVTTSPPEVGSTVPPTVPASGPVATGVAATDTAGSAPSTIAAPADETGITSDPSSSEPMTAEELTVRLDEIRAAQQNALRTFDSIGFTVVRTRTDEQGNPFDDGSGIELAPVQVVLRNDGSLALASDSFGASYYDASTGTARAVYTDQNGLPAYQQLDGQADSSVALGVPTGLPNGIVTDVTWLEGGLVAITEDEVDGRSTWRIEQRTTDPMASVTVTWIDRATGVTVQTRNNGSTYLVGDVETRVIETITLTDLRPGAPLPENVADPFPPGVGIQLSGTPDGFEATTIEAATAAMPGFGSSILVPTLPADQVAITRVAIGNTPDGALVFNPTLRIRWFDGFLRTEFSLSRLNFDPNAPPCGDCASRLLAALRAATIEPSGITATVDDATATITGDPATIRAIIDSLTTTA